MTRVVIVDCGIGNLRSVQKAFERLGAAAPISDDAAAVAAADAVVLPGVGAFGDAMAKLDAKALTPALREHALAKRKPILGICLGMQLMARESTEGGRHQGLGLVAGSVREIDVGGKRDWAGRKLTLPHIGWNAVAARPGATLFRGVPQGSDFYFVHGYHLAAEAPEIVATCEYGGPIACAIERGNIFAVQFHPEKSQEAGRLLLRNFVELSAARAAA